MTTDPPSYRFNHSMIRVKEPQRSIKFYEDLGMKVLDKMQMPQAKFDLYFLGYDVPGAPSHGKTRSDREGILELTHNYGSESDPDFKIENGNNEPYKGFGHTCISVDNIQAACQRLEDKGYKFQKKLTDGKMKSIAFVLDPDGYWVEIISQKSVEETKDVKETDPSSYRFNHTMIRVKDAEKSLKFYQEVMGMSLLKTIENKDAGFNLYFLSYGKPKSETSGNDVNPMADGEGILELTWNYGTEKDENFKYHSGNEKPQGFGHICMTVDSFTDANKRFEALGVEFQKKPTDGKMSHISFIKDPDGYWIEIVQNQTLKQ